jgi:hypothetical protein
VNELRSGKRSLVWLGATAAFTVVGCSWAFSIARYGGPDEPAHIIRAAAVADGDLLGKPVAGLEPGYRQVTVAKTLASGDPSCFRHDDLVTAECSVASSKSDRIAVATSAGTAPPWYYWIVGVVPRALSDGGALAYRMVTVVLCSAILGFALDRSRRYGGGGWMLIALTPAAWFLFAVVGTSGIEIALVTLALVEAVARFDSRDASLARVIVPLAICLALRPSAVIDVAVVGLALAPTITRPIRIKTVRTIVSPLVAAAAVTAAWSRWTGLVVDDRRTADADKLPTAVRRSVHGIPETVHQAIGALGWNEFFAPFAAQMVWVFALGFAAWWTVAHASDHWWHVRWLAAAVLLPVVLEVVLHRRVGEIWQGRYSIAFGIGGVLYAARVNRDSLFLGRLVIVAAFAEVLTLWHTLRRYMVGLHGSLTLRHAAWHPPLNPWLLIAINAAAMAALVVASESQGTM